MPGPITHSIFYKELKTKLNKKTLDSLPNYDNYSVFAQGHDFLIYHNFYNPFKLNYSVGMAVLLQENRFADFVYEYLKSACENGAIEDEQVRLFIGAGYISHHLLDAYTHPHIIYFSGDYTKNPKHKTWYHGIAENLIDIYMMKTREGLDPKFYEVHKQFIINGVISAKLLDNIKLSFGTIYKIPNADVIFKKSFRDVALFMYVLKYDPIGIKRFLFDTIDFLTKGSSSFSYHRDYQDALEYLNLEREEWTHPMFTDQTYNSSFIDSYDKALNECAHIIDELEKLCQHGFIHRDDIGNLIPDISSSHGGPCGQELEIRRTRRSN